MVDLQWDRGFALEQSGDDEELLAELLELFRDSGASDLEKIKQGMSAQDAEAVGDAAHSIKGAAASLGIEGIRAAAHGVEKAGRAADLDAAVKLVADLEAMMAQIKDLK
ncbi:MAG: Hpt domain-containing protein [Desulfobulbaceae bacterium]|nr:Hpt domain-containing protein [Desulfobulbaceae bacterium]MCK5323906.1 Hpt domain-containing protein [Desulfobulbaceae bacterium]MCK5436903.1 Hpt domain-containing protein [Desulfobulbaceae bacterium]